VVINSKLMLAMFCEEGMIEVAVPLNLILWSVNYVWLPHGMSEEEEFIV
jgi:hypothetical protein